VGNQPNIEELTQTLGAKATILRSLEDSMNKNPTLSNITEQVVEQRKDIKEGLSPLSLTHSHSIFQPKYD